MRRYQPRSLASRFTLASLLSVGLSACFEDGDSDADPDTDTDGVGSSQPSVVTATTGSEGSSGDPASTSTGGESLSDSTVSEPSTGDESDTDGAGSSSSTGAPAVCGDGVVEGDEECDGDEVGDAACPIVGEVTCTAECTVDTSACTDTVTVCDTPAAAFGVNWAYTSVSVSEDFFVADVNVYLDVSHTYVGDTIAILTDPAGTVVEFLTDSDCEFLDLEAWFDDDAEAGPGCAETTPSISGVVLPFEPLSTFVGGPSTGEWELNLQDGWQAEDDGILNEWCLELTLSANDPTDQIL